MQTEEVEELTKVHFLQVHSRSVVVGLEDGAMNETFCMTFHVNSKKQITYLDDK